MVFILIINNSLFYLSFVLFYMFSSGREQPSQEAQF